MINFIKRMLSNYLIRKTYKNEIKNFGYNNQLQIDLMLGNNTKA